MTKIRIYELDGYPGNLQWNCDLCGWCGNITSSMVYTGPGGKSIHECNNAWPTPPDGWVLIPPSDAKKGDALLSIDGDVTILDDTIFNLIPIGKRRISWAIRKRRRGEGSIFDNQ